MPTKQARTNPAVKVALGFVAQINAHDVSGITALMTEDHVFVDSLGNRQHGRQNMTEGWRAYLEAFPDYTIVVEQSFASGPVVMLWGRARGTFASAGQLRDENRWDIPAAWKAVIRDGHVAEWHVCADNDPVRRVMAK